MQPGQEIPAHHHQAAGAEFGAKVPRGVDWDGNYRDYVDAVRRAPQHARRRGSAIRSKPTRFAYVANTAARSASSSMSTRTALAVNFDPSHTFPIGDFPNITVYQLGKPIIHFHVSDNDGVTNVHWRPGMGQDRLEGDVPGSEGRRL